MICHAFEKEWSWTWKPLVLYAFVLGQILRPRVAFGLQSNCVTREKEGG